MTFENMLSISILVWIVILADCKIVKELLRSFRQVNLKMKYYADSSFLG